MPDRSIAIACRVNGETVTFDTHPMARLLDVLRVQLRLTGTKEGCGEGECGACSVLLNGRLVNSCLVPVLHADGAEIVTVEGLAPDGALTPLQAAFRSHHALQCGFCTPGILIAADELLSRGMPTSREEIVDLLSGHLCRCTGYTAIVDAIAEVARA